MAEEWFYAKDGQQAVGPISATQLKQLAASAQVGPNDLVWKQGMAQWTPAVQIKGLLSGSVDQRSASSTQRQGQVETPSPQAAFNSPAATPGVPIAADEFGVAEKSAEPWFYWFIEKYTKFFMWIGVALCAVSFAYQFYTLIQMLGNDLIPGSTRFYYLGFFFVVMIPAHALAALWILFCSALFLLAVDAGRNLRSVRQNTSR